jgi:hypothetical protein
VDIKNEIIAVPKHCCRYRRALAVSSTAKGAKMEATTVLGTAVGI